MTSPLRESSWSGLVTGNREPPDAVGIRLVLRPSEHGLAGSFLALGMDGRRWWVKPPHQGDPDRGLVTEFVVGRVGALIGAPTCENSVVEIPDVFTGWEFARGKTLKAGFGHGTVEVEAAIEERPNLKYRNDDDNRVRHAGIFALHDLCWGSDQQWLHSTTNQNSIYSHDHGFFLPPSGWGWDVDALRAYVDRPRPLMQSAEGLAQSDLWSVADEIDKVDKAALLGILRRVPQAWPVSDSQLETLGWFLERRAGAVASRLRELL
ncbi:HipA family kinase [Actinoplanes sp. NPDC048967]|uniref:HipA family kinase n=1 Tax=Actinoplanes sp. NPDC048967 TaxID=3155269 RepID=UPI0033FD996B